MAQYKGGATFDRERLRKIMVGQNQENPDIFLVISKRLDRDTLDVTRIESFWTKKSLTMVVALFLTGFCPEGKVEI